VEPAAWVLFFVSLVFLIVTFCCYVIQCSDVFSSDGYGISHVNIQSASRDIVCYALAILKLIILCTLKYFAVLYSFLIASIDTGTAYSSCGSIAPLYIAFSDSCLSLPIILAELDNAFISLVHLSMMNFV